MTDFMTLANTSITDLATVLKDSALSDVTKTSIVSDYLLAKVGALPRRFDYRKPVTADPDGAPTFVRKFQHVDWVDGESRVQAGETLNERGFNRRFNDIAADLDALHGDDQRLWASHVALVSELIGVLGELRAEINRLTAEIQGQGRQPKAAEVGPLVQFEIPKSNKQFVQIGGKPYWLYSDAGRSIAVEASDLKVAGGPSVSGLVGDPRASDAVRVAKHIIERKPLEEFIRTENPTRDALVARFGTERMADGSQLSDALARLPAETRFDSPETLTDALARSEADDLRLTTGKREMLETTISVEAAREQAATAPLGETRFLSPQLSEALTGAGIDTIGSLAAAPVDRVAGIARERGVSLSASEAAEVVAISKLMRHL